MPQNSQKQKARSANLAQNEKGGRNKCQVDQKWRGVMKFRNVTIGIDENTSISYANQRVQNEDPSDNDNDVSDSCTRQALLYLALHVLSCQFDSPTLPEAGEEV